MHRKIVWPGQIPLETDLLDTNKYAMIAIAKLSAAVLGTGTLLNGLACTPNSPAALNVLVAPGEIYSTQNIDGTAYSSLAADVLHSITKQGISLDTVTLSTPAPATAGFSVNYLVQIAYTDTDTDAVVLPYYNASNPAMAYSGPNNTGVAQPTVRKGVCNVTVKTGVAAASGTQTTPAPDAGYTGAYVVTVANGATTVIAGNISLYAGAPFLTNTLVDAITIVSQAEAEAGVATTLRGWTAERVRQAAKASLGGGILSKSVAGAVDVTLTTTEASNALITFTGAITASINVIFPATAGSWIVKNTTTGNFTLTVKTAAGASVEINGDSNVHVWCDGVGIYRSETVQPVVRVVSVASTSFPSPPVDICDIYKVTALATAAAITAPTSYTHSIAEGQGMVMRIKDNGTARALTWDAIYRPIGLTLPTTTVAGKTLYVGMFYNLTDSKWDIVGLNQE